MSYTPLRDIEQIIRQMRAICPEVTVAQLLKVYPGSEDSSLWFFSQPRKYIKVQLKSSNGMCPFFIETSKRNSQFKAQSTAQAVDLLCRLLHLSLPT
jgi:hypothetical protein